MQGLANRMRAPSMDIPPPCVGQLDYNVTKATLREQMHCFLGVFFTDYSLSFYIW